MILINSIATFKQLQIVKKYDSRMRVITASRSLHTTSSIYGRGVKFSSHLEAVERRKWRFSVRTKMVNSNDHWFMLLETNKS